MIYFELSQAFSSQKNKIKHIWFLSCYHSSYLIIRNFLAETIINTIQPIKMRTNNTLTNSKNIYAKSHFSTTKNDCFFIRFLYFAPHFATRSPWHINFPLFVVVSLGVIKIKILYMYTILFNIVSLFSPRFETSRSEKSNIH